MSTKIENMLNMASGTESAIKTNDLAHSYHHGKHSASNLHESMTMSFHIGYKETILFEFWKTESLSSFLLSCLILFLAAFAYEGLKLVRELLIRRELAHTRTNILLNSTININKQCNCNKNQLNAFTKENTKDSCIMIAGEDKVAFVNTKYQHKCCCTPSNHQKNDSKIISIKSYSMRLFSKGHLTQTLLHMIQITLSYLLMLVFMTYNTWLCLSVVLGAMLGFFVFGTHRLTSIQIDEQCH